MNKLFLFLSALILIFVLTAENVDAAGCGEGWGQPSCSAPVTPNASPEGPIEDAIIKASTALIPEAAQWLYKNAKERGVAGASWDHYRATNISLALKLNAKGPVYALVGTEILAQKSMDKLLENNPDAGRLRIFAAPALDFIWLYEKLLGIKTVKNLDLLKAPESWNFIAGPQVNIPATNWGDWTWKTHTRLFIAFTAKGG